MLPFIYLLQTIYGMKSRLMIFFIFTIFSTILVAQNLSVPDSILVELRTKKVLDLKNPQYPFIFQVVYPEHYDATKTYPILLGLSGGNQSKAIVNYCYAAWFKSNYFKDYLTILPVNTNGKNLANYSQNDIRNMLSAIKNNFQVTTKNWIVSGTSNGGVATFNFVAEDPTLFQGIIVTPGKIQKQVKIKNSWKHLKVILAYGEKDADYWIKGTEMTEKMLSKHVKDVHTVVLKEQGHILPLDFDIDFVYKNYFVDNRN